jgi:hypothetical protein
MGRGSAKVTSVMDGKLGWLGDEDRGQGLGTRDQA